VGSYRLFDRASRFDSLARKDAQNPPGKEVAHIFAWNDHAQVGAGIARHEDRIHIAVGIDSRTAGIARVGAAFDADILHASIDFVVVTTVDSRFAGLQRGGDIDSEPLLDQVFEVSAERK